MFKTPRTHLTLRCRRVLLLLLPVLLAGCYEVHYGLYDASEIPGGWQGRQRAGLTCFTQSTLPKPAWAISTSSRQKGELFFDLDSTAWDPMPFFNSVAFSGDAIRIIFHDGDRQEKDISAKDLILRHCQLVKVGDSEDFTVVLPPFTVGDTNIPTLSARFQWSDRKYRQWVPLQ